MNSEPALEPLSRPELEELFETLEAPLLRFAYKLVMNADNAQDLVQEAFIRLARQDAVKSPRAWLYATVHNQAMNCLRAQGKVVSLQSVAGGEGAPTPDDAPLPADLLERRERAGTVRVCLERLPDRDRTLIDLKYQQGFSYQQIAQRMGMTVSNVGYCLHHALKSMEIELRREGVAS